MIGDSSDGLGTPRDLEFNPESPDQLWVVNRTEAMVIFYDTGSASQSTSWHSGPGAHHFFAQPSGLAFGVNEAMATIHETDELTQGPLPAGSPHDFMGPTLHWTDTSYFDAGHKSHLDMLHNTPLGMGIAWHGGNTYWVFDGYHSSISLYVFNEDHGAGGADHSDGKVRRYVEGKVKRQPDVPSHMELDRITKLLYIADTGNNRIAALDTTTGSQGANLYPNYDGGQQNYMNGASIWTVIDGADHDMQHPSGLALVDDLIFVTDNATGRVLAFTLDGELVDWLDTERPAGALMGMTFDDDGRLYLVDALSDEVFRISVPGD